jgi:hypothetical protein
LFERETGIKGGEWCPQFWLRWGDAVEEAGFARNTFLKPFSAEFLLEHYSRLAQHLGHLPIQAELNRESMVKESFPSEKVFRRFGGKSKLLSAVAEFCRAHAGFDDVLGFCEAR